MPAILKIDEIKYLLKDVDINHAMEIGFRAYSNGKSVVPPVGELLFANPPGDVHIKYGYILDDDYYVVKIASGFYENPRLGIASSQGLMLLFKQQTGELVALLLDDGYLTDIRTAAAGALAAQYFAPKIIKSIGIIGTGVQAKLQLEHLQNQTDCKRVWLWGRNLEKSEILKNKLKSNFDIQIAADPKEVALHSQLIVTTTPSETPLLQKEDLQPGTHITAIGSDTGTKQELAGKILAHADLVVVDSLSQSASRGEVFQAVKLGVLSPKNVIELGKAIQDPKLQRSSDDQLTVVDLTGVAVQDIMIAKSVFLKYQQTKNNELLE
ncbi:MAG: ornithine cyclodeaminase family protein [Flammeovirgaceae bacterium]|nr:ornithine cyclodeaminase family protein [Flammeovirgaceae bacterium]